MDDLPATPGDAETMRKIGLNNLRIPKGNIKMFTGNGKALPIK